MKVLIDHHWVKEIAVIIAEGKIIAMVPESRIQQYSPAQEYFFSNDHYLVPGFIDLHIHGANGSDVMDSEPSALHTISQSLPAEGVTGFLATTLTATEEETTTALQNIAAAMLENKGAAILGIHLEGPFIATEKLGAQGNHCRSPNLALFKKWQKMTDHAIKIVTLAPELEHAISFIEAVAAQGVIASIGHTNASYEQTSAAIKAGAKQATHLFNAMRGLHQREPGAVGALLHADEVWAEVIADGIHLHPMIVAMACKLKMPERLLLVTDAMRAKCLQYGRYQLGQHWVDVSETGARLADGTLAGSTLRMQQAIKNMMLFSQCSLIDAVKMASENPAKVLNLFERKGSIAIGKDADLVVLNERLEVELTLRDGVKTYHLQA